jgi:chemosensory pili system protein ChpA (sensor histidine kinase/response regulator)
MVQSARRIRARELHLSLQSGTLEWPDAGDITLRPLAQLLGQTYQITPNESQSVALLQIGDDRLAISANELSASQEIVVKNVGPQVSRLSGILGATVLGDGQVVLIVNPVQLVSRAPDPMTLESLDSGGTPRHDALAPLVMIVDDSLTVRRVTQRLLERHGYRTVLAKDGVDALREMQAATPDIMLVDIEMPRMDGFDLTRNVRSNGLTRQIPIIMITSRTAEKHRRVAFDLGVNEYLGKPYREDDLLRLLDRYTAHDSFPVSPFSPNSGKIHSTFSV